MYFFKSMNMIHMNFPKIVFRFLNFYDLRPFTPAPANYPSNSVSSKMLRRIICSIDGKVMSVIPDSKKFLA
jgi:hypothetical protein